MTRFRGGGSEPKNRRDHHAGGHTFQIPRDTGVSDGKKRDNGGGNKSRNHYQLPNVKNLWLGSNGHPSPFSRNTFLNNIRLCNRPPPPHPFRCFHHLAARPLCADFLFFFFYPTSPPLPHSCKPVLSPLILSGYQTLFKKFLTGAALAEKEERDEKEIAHHVTTIKYGLSYPILSRKKNGSGPFQRSL